MIMCTVCMNNVIIVIGMLCNFIEAASGKEQPVTEPDYHHLTYGNVWRYIIFAPHASQEILKAKQHLSHIIEKHYPEIAHDADLLRCTSHQVLWYTVTDKTPMVLDSYVHDKEGHEYPVSVPVSFGSTFNFLLMIHKNSISTIHAFTITKTNENAFHLYSHIFYTVATSAMDKENGCTCNCEREKSMNHRILSTLALTKHSELHSENICILYDQNVNVQMSNMTFNGIKQSAQPEPAKPDRKMEAVEAITAMSYNIWNFNAYKQSNSHQGQYAARFKRISQLLQETQPDIVGFQEVRFEQASGGKLSPNQIKHLASALPGYQYVYQPAQLMPDSFQRGRTEEGVAIFSKYPIIHHDYLLLFRNRHNSADQHQRVCLHAAIHIPAIGRVHVFNTHLSLSHEAREESVSQILQFMKEVGRDEPALLMGDLNATPEEKAIRMLSENSSLSDVWDILYPKSRGYTFNNLEDELSKRIDYIFLKKIENMKPAKMEVLHDGSKSKAASDHRPVLATLSFKT